MVGDILQPTHLLFVLVVALLVLGPKRLPEVGRSLGRGLRDFRSAISGEDRPESTIPPASDPAPPRPEVHYPGIDAEPFSQPTQDPSPTEPEPFGETPQAETLSHTAETLTHDDHSSESHATDEAAPETSEPAEPVTAAKSDSSS